MKWEVLQAPARFQLQIIQTPQRSSRPREWALARFAMTSQKLAEMTHALAVLARNSSIATAKLAVLIREDGRVLLAKRAAQKIDGGLWEFPGGKVERLESPVTALGRELLEELGITLGVAEPLMSVLANESGAGIDLHVFSSRNWIGSPVPLEHSELAWAQPNRLRRFAMPSADKPVQKRISRPTHYAISPDFSADFSIERILDWLSGAVDRRAGWLLLRCEALTARSDRDEVFFRINHVADQHGADVLVSGLAMLRVAFDVGGVQLRSAELFHLFGLFHGVDAAKKIRHWLREQAGSSAFQDRAEFILAASCHNQEELRMAVHLGCDFVTVSPVRETLSHPHTPPLGWPIFSKLAQSTQLPIYALGGMQESDLAIALECGAAGIAGISLFNAR
jgi:8-oxo-dGTP diphosphatase